MNNSKYVKIIIFLATIVTMLVGNFAYDLSKTIDFGKVTGKSVWEKTKSQIMKKER